MPRMIRAAVGSRAQLAWGIDLGRSPVVDGETGCLVPPRDREAIAEALGKLASSTALRASYGLAAQARVAQDFSIEREVTAITDAYQKVLA